MTQYTAPESVGDDEPVTDPGPWPTVSTQPDLPAMEEEILAGWREHDVFRRSIELRADGPLWTFYEGPPTANGKPGTHHVEARTFKDVFPRYRTMKGYQVPRKGGWDCHGLPVELEIERELGLNSKADIERYGIEEFNRRCRESVTRYVDAWVELTDRIGFWVDTDDPYWTMDATYVDSLWWGLSQLWEAGLIFEDHRVTPYCARCGTGLSDAEVAQGYETVEDPSVYVRFPLLDAEGDLAAAGLVVWTTTPWTLPSNTAVAVGRDVRYQLVETYGDRLVIAADRRQDVLGEEVMVMRDLAVDELLGLHYEAPFTLIETDQDHRYVVEADFVSTDTGSGLVHMAPAFGSDDMEVGRREGLPVINPVDLEGRFTTGPWKGRFVKDADPLIIEALEERGALLRSETYTHTYPFCWRCKRPLIYYAKPSWYIRTTARRDELLRNNEAIDWYPDHIKTGRFGNWLENNVDWALSRDRYWGTPLPFWRCDGCSDITVVSSRADLGQHADRDLTELDPHRPYVDEITFRCGGCGGTKRRVPDVADAWFDSGAMPYAQWGYPHQGQEEFERHFPADYICEAIDQTRGWFYTLLAESTLLFDDTSYRTCLCLGHIVDEDGAKMSKSKGNVIDPWDLIHRHGADALRWLMLAEGSPWVNRRVGHHVLEDVVRRFFLTLWNTHYFFLTYAAIDGFAPRAGRPDPSSRPLSDRWVLAELAAVIDEVDAAMERFDPSTACRRIEAFVDDLSNWYVRRNRRRFWKAAGEDPEDKRAAYATLHTCLTMTARLLAPFAPFLADRLWQDLVRSQDDDAPLSVHLTHFPSPPDDWRDEDLRGAMSSVRRVVELGRQARNESGVRTRQPLARALVTVPPAEREGLQRLLQEVAEELNVKDVELSDETSELVRRSLKPDFSTLGPRFQSDAPRIAQALRELDEEHAHELAGRIRAGATAIMEVDGRDVTLEPDMVEIIETPRTGWQVASDAGTSIALDLELTDALVVEGFARELVRALNDQRKDLDLALDRRIEVAIHVTPRELDEALADAGWYDYIGREVLADAVHRRPEADASRVELGDRGSAEVAVIAP